MQNFKATGIYCKFPGVVGSDAAAEFQAGGRGEKKKDFQEL
jgi:hypothetical protein